MGRRGVGLWAGAVLLVASAAWAQPQSEDALLRECYMLRQQGQHRPALERCQRAVQIARTGRSVAQLAITEFALEQWAPAATHLAEALADRVHPWVQQNRATLEETLGRVRPHVAELAVGSNEREATVTVNGEVRGTLPLVTPLYLAPGAVRLVVRARSGEEIAREVTLAAGQRATESVQFVRTTVVVPSVVAVPSPPPPVPTTSLAVPPTTSPAVPPVVVAGVSPPVATPVPSSTRRVLAWTAGGAAVAGLALSLVAWRLREGAVADYAGQCPAEVESATEMERCAGLHAAAQTDVGQWQAVSTAGLVAGGVFAVGSAVLFATLSSGRSGERRAVRCGGGPGVVGIGCEVAF